MGKVILEFDSVEEAQEAKDALNVSSYKTILWELDQKLRSTIRREVSIISTSNSASEEEIKVAEKYRETLYDLLQKYSVNLD